jgi:hypothetical protein
MTFNTASSARRIAAAALACSAAMAMPAQASAVISQAWVATWDLGGPPDAPHLVGEASGGGSTGGTTTLSADVPKGSLSGSITTSFDTAQGRLRSGSNVDVTLNCCTAPDKYGWGDFFLLVYSSLTINDQLTVDHDGFGFMKIMVRTTGNRVQHGQIVDPPYGYADVSMTNKVRLDASVTGIDAGSFADEVNSEFKGISDGVFQVDETREVYNFMELIIPWTDDQPVDFDFRYDDFMQYQVEGIDAERVTLSGENNFGHTLQLFADVYDEQGRLLQGVRVGSSSGIGYLNLDPGADPGPGSPVPEPSTLALLALGAGVAMSRRRRTV